MPSTIPNVTLNDGSTHPMVGLGLYKVPDPETEELVLAALDMGFRLLDTAAMYENEAGVGRAVSQTRVPREDIIVATKFWMDGLGHQNTIDACHGSLERLGLDYIDLFLIHWPAPQRDLYVESWQAMQELKEQGLVRSIGVCNFHIEHLERIITETGTVPVLNQVEVHPWLTQQPLMEYHQSQQIQTQAWSPLARGQILEEPTLVELSKAYDKSVAQIILRWHIQRECSLLTKSVSPERLQKNMEVFGFELSEGDMETITGLNKDYRTGVDPNDRN